MYVCECLFLSLSVYFCPSLSLHISTCSLFLNTSLQVGVTYRHHAPWQRVKTVNIYPYSEPDGSWHCAFRIQPSLVPSPPAPSSGLLSPLLLPPTPYPCPAPQSLQPSPMPSLCPEAHRLGKVRRLHWASTSTYMWPHAGGSGRVRALAAVIDV